MDQNTVIAIVVVALIAIATIIFVIYRKRRSEHLKSRFGTEYDRAVLLGGDRAKAEAELLSREKRVHRFPIRELPPASRDRYLEEWTAIQSRFVDDPAVAVNEADSLVNRVMAARGYPMAEFEQRAADLSVTHPDVVQNYRAARAVMLRYGRGEAGTEDLRQAMVYYRTLFDELLDITPKPHTATREALHQRAS